MILVGQSLELSLPHLLEPMRARRPEAFRRRLLRQVEAGATAIDLNGGVHADAADLAWCARIAWDALPGIPLFVDTASPVVIAETLDACRRTGIVGPLVANSLAAGEDGAFEAAALAALHAASRAGAGVVLSARTADGRGARDAAPAERIAAAARRAAEDARAAGITATVYLDALAFPPLSDPVRCARSLEVLRAWREVREIEPLSAPGNVGYGADPEVAAALRAVYAAAAVGAGARALILPVEEAATRRAACLAAGEIAPASTEDRWFLEVAAAAAAGDRPGGAPEPYAQAARLVFGG